MFKSLFFCPTYVHPACVIKTDDDWNNSWILIYFLFLKKPHHFRPNDSKIRKGVGGQRRTRNSLNRYFRGINQIVFAMTLTLTQVFGPLNLWASLPTFLLYYLFYSSFEHNDPEGPVKDTNVSRHFYFKNFFFCTIPIHLAWLLSNSAGYCKKKLVIQISISQKRMESR